MTGDRHLESAVLDRLAATHVARGDLDEAERVRVRARSAREEMDHVPG